MQPTLQEIFKNNLTSSTNMRTLHFVMKNCIVLTKILKIRGDKSENVFHEEHRKGPRTYAIFLQVFLQTDDGGTNVKTTIRAENAI